MSLLSLLLLALVGTTGAFLGEFRSPVRTALFDSEENEWYSPPVQVDPTPLRPPGIVPSAETIIQSPEEFLSFLHGNDEKEEERLTIVKYHAEWCKSCQRFNLHMDKLRQKHADLVHKSDPTNIHKRGQVRFGSIEFNHNEALCHNQKIETLPTTRFYVQGQLVAEVTGGTKNIGQVQDLLAYHVQKLRMQASKKKKQQQPVTLD